MTLPPRAIFRAYDIRGIVGEQLTPAGATLIGRALATKALAGGADRIAVGRDGRASSPELAEAFAEGIRQVGIATVDIGLAPTPAAYWAAFELADGNGAVITGSHNPKEYNGIKMMLSGATLAGEEIEQLYLLIAEQRLAGAGVAGAHEARDIMADYIAAVVGERTLARPIKIVVDCGNGVTGPSAPQALERLGCEVLPLYTEVDGSFPNHHPDPAEPANLAAAMELMRAEGAEMAIAFDGDGDRVGVCLPEAGMIYPDRILMALARDFLLANPGEAIVYDVKCSRLLSEFIARRGGKPVMCRTGHSFVKQKMAAIGARLGGELSGHIFFNEGRWKFDDALLAAIKLIALAAGADSAEELFAQIPSAPATPELKAHLAADDPEPAELVELFARSAKFSTPPEQLVTLDGLRAEWADGFGLLRASNTTRCLIMRFEGDTEAALRRIRDDFAGNLLRIKSDLRLPA